MRDTTTEVSFRLQLRDAADISPARRCVRELAQRVGLTHTAAEALATAVSEVARNVIDHSSGGEVFLSVVEESDRAAVLVITRDHGPGISDIESAMRDGYSTGSGLGLGLPSARRLVDEFDLRSVVGQGTTITLKKWRPRGA